MAPPDFALLTRRVRDYIADAIRPGSRRPDAGSFEGLALALFAAQYRAVPPYAEFARRQGRTPETVSHWEDIPAIPTDAFRELDCTSLPAADRAVVFRSSGTTEAIPGRHHHGFESLAVYRDSLRPWFGRHLAPDAATAGMPRWAALTPSAAEAPHSSLVFMFECVMAASDSGSRWFGTPDAGGAWRLRLPELISFLQESSRDHRPVGLLGTAFSFVELIDALETAGLGFQLPAGSRVLETGGYKGRSRELPKPALYEAIERFLGVSPSHLVSEYGMTELGSQAYDRVVGSDAPRCFRFPPWARATVISPDTLREVPVGGIGLLRIHDLANVRSVAAIRTGDLAVRRADGFELLGRAAAAAPRGCSLMVA